MTTCSRSTFYRGRFAPSPTGPLHFGSLVAALGSYLQARQARGQWLVRIEDIDQPRSVPGAADQILQTLEKLGLYWDEPVIYQSTRLSAYEQAFQLLKENGHIYPCSCSRSELQALQTTPSAAHEELHYPGLCRNGPTRPSETYAWRFRVPTQAITFIDQIQGKQAIQLQKSIGDFVIKRRDGLFAYQLAVVVDDAAQGITEVVRGTDLLSNTPRQIALQNALNLETPSYLHLPIAIDEHGRKLSKSNGATAVSTENSTQTIWNALCFLKQNPPTELQKASLNRVWEWAIEYWDIKSLSNIEHQICEYPYLR